MDHVCVIEGIMGSGKSSAVINQILRNSREKTMIIVNYIKEGERYKEKLEEKNFKLMGETIKHSKTADLKRALEKQENIICTKALFEMNMHLIKEYVSEYILIIDEAMNDIIETYKFPSLYITHGKNEEENKELDKKKSGKNKLKVDCKNLKEYSITEKDMRIMLSNEILIKEEETSKLLWNNKLEEPTIYDIIKEDFSTYDIYEFQNNYIKVIPLEIFKAFKRIIVLIPTSFNLLFNNHTSQFIISFYFYKH